MNEGSELKAKLASLTHLAGVPFVALIAAATRRWLEAMLQCSTIRPLHTSAASLFGGTP